MSPQTRELKTSDRPFVDLPKRILKGEVFVVRNCLQEIGLFDKLERMSFTGIITSSAMNQPIVSEMLVLKKYILS